MARYRGEVVGQGVGENLAEQIRATRLGNRKDLDVLNRFLPAPDAAGDLDAVTAGRKVPEDGPRDDLRAA